MLCVNGGEAERVCGRRNGGPVQVKRIPVGRVECGWLMGLHVEDGSVDDRQESSAMTIADGGKRKLKTRA